MDDRRFDDLVRTVAGGPANRRGVVRFLGGGSLAALLARLGMEEVAATHDGCRHLGVGCTRSGQCCSERCKKKPGNTRGRCACSVGTVADKGACIPRVPCANNDACGDGSPGSKVCTNGVCKCPEGEGDCAGLNQCGPLSGDVNYCGACDVKCAQGANCVNGICECPADRPKVCGGVCKECCGKADCVGGTCAEGACNCPSTVPVCSGQCCVTGETCLETGCGSCPQGSDFCNASPCGDNCFCATPTNGTTGCFNVTCLPEAPGGSGCTDFVCQLGGFGEFAVLAQCCPSGCACIGNPCGGE